VCVFGCAVLKCVGGYAVRKCMGVGLLWNNG